LDREYIEIVNSVGLGISFNAERQPEDVAKFDFVNPPYIEFVLISCKVDWSSDFDRTPTERGT